MAMAHGVEQRMPYLDEAVLALACSLPPALKLRGLRDKILLRRLAARRLPAALAWRRKQAYRAPESSVFFAGQKPLPWVRDALEPKAVQEAGLFEHQAVARLLQRCASQPAVLGDADHIALVGVLSTMLLHRQYVQGHAWTPGHMAH
jgi:asparagine synthase (glutamine-hydrolysing)